MLHICAHKRPHIVARVPSAFCRSCAVARAEGGSLYCVVHTCRHNDLGDRLTHSKFNVQVTLFHSSSGPILHRRALGFASCFFQHFASRISHIFGFISCIAHTGFWNALFSTHSPISILALDSGRLLLVVEVRCTTPYISHAPSFSASVASCRIIVSCGI